jgi:putative membrane protein
MYMEHKISPGTGHSARRWTRITASAAAATLLLTLVPTASATNGDGVTPTCDEAYYATTDYYGNLSKGSVVKSYAMNGESKVTDYGTYKKVTNLTDDTKAQTSGDKTTFNFGKDVPDHFYFEGETSQPFDDLPWKLSLTYKLNGVPVKASKLKGKSGMVEIDLDMVPNKNASEYARNNYTLETMTAFNQNDILSLKAEGAQVQLVGNLRMVLFVALPGEEQHVSIQVGTDDFQFDGMTYLMVPATLSQLKQISDLKAKKGELESDYNSLSSSFDQMLSSMNSMSASLNSAASGLDEMSSALGSMSGASGIYSATDLVKADLGKIASSLEPVADQIDEEVKALGDTHQSVQKLVDATVSLKKELTDLRADLTKLQADGTNAKQVVTDTKNLQSTLSALRVAMGTISSQAKMPVTASDSMTKVINLGTLYNTLTSVNSKVPASSTDNFENAFFSAVLTSKGVPVSSQSALIAICKSGNQTEMNAADAQFGVPTGTLYSLFSACKAYESAYATAGQAPSFAQFCTALLTLQTTGGTRALTAAESKTVAATADQMNNIWTIYSNSAVGADQQKNNQAMLSLMMSNLDSTATAANSSIDKVDAAILGPTQNLISGLETICSELTVLNTAIDDAGSTAEVIKTATTKGEAILDALSGLNKTVNSYLPTAQKTLKSVGAMSKTAAGTMTDTANLISALETYAKQNGQKLTSGSQRALSSLSSTLRQAAKGLGATGSLSASKKNIDKIITDTWEKYTGKVNNLLNMDANAPAESLTSDENAAPESVQVLIRTHEIKTAEKDTSSDKEKTADKGTFWSRLAGIFTGIWKDITGKSDN